MRNRSEHTFVLAGLIAILAGPHAWPAQAAPLSGPQACSVLKKLMGVHDAVPPSRLDQTWSCDVTTDDDNSHPDWWVIGLRSFRQCEGICSNLRGWFAIHRKTGEIREWDVAELKVGGPIGSP
jgi:hypothetical protein